MEFVLNNEFQVGTHLMSATLRQLGFSIELVYGNLDWALAETHLTKKLSHIQYFGNFNIAYIVES